MSICRARLRDTSNALTLRISSEQTRLQVSSKSFGVNSWIPQMMRQWIPDSWSGDRKCTGPKGVAVNSRNWQLMTSGRSQVVAISNFRDWHTVVGEIPRAGCRRHWWTVTASLYYTRWRITSQCRSSCISRDRPRSYFQVPVTRRAAAYWTCCNLFVTFVGAKDKTELQ